MNNERWRRLFLYFNSSLIILIISSREVAQHFVVKGKEKFFDVFFFIGNAGHNEENISFGGDADRCGGIEGNEIFEPGVSQQWEFGTGKLFEVLFVF